MILFEECKEIPGYEGIYKISSKGRVYSTPRPRTKGGILNPSISNSGYLRTALTFNQKKI